MQEKYRKILAAARAGERSSLVFQIGGEAYERHFSPKERLILLGAGHISQQVCKYAADLGWAVTVVDDRPDYANYTRFPAAEEVICRDFVSALRGLDINEADYVAVLTRGHRYDADCLRVILPGTMPRYLGMIGSRRRVAALYDLLEGEGQSRERMNAIHSPIGVSVNALSPKEIAISIVAELIGCRRKDVPRHGSGTRLVTEDIDFPLLEFLAEEESPKALLLVLETEGSTPVKSGAMMAVNRARQTAGTIGGGCSENEVMGEAVRLIGTGEMKCVDVDMAGDVEDEEGMVCGGAMRVLVMDAYS